MNRQTGEMDEARAAEVMAESAPSGSHLSAWRRNTVSDLTGAFRGPGYYPAVPTFPDTNGDMNLAAYTSSALPRPAVPGANQTFPVQERGHRPHTH